jgi:hypothetical protein
MGTGSQCLPIARPERRHTNLFGTAHERARCSRNLYQARSPRSVYGCAFVAPPLGRTCGGYVLCFARLDDLPGLWREAAGRGDRCQRTRTVFARGPAIGEVLRDLRSESDVRAATCSPRRLVQNIETSARRVPVPRRARAARRGASFSPGQQAEREALKPLGASG